MIADYGETFETAIPRKVSNTTPPHYNMVLTHDISFNTQHSQFLLISSLLLSFVLERLQDDLQSQGDML